MPTLPTNSPSVVTIVTNGGPGKNDGSNAAGRIDAVAAPVTNPIPTHQQDEDAVYTAALAQLEQLVIEQLISALAGDNAQWQQALRQKVAEFRQQLLRPEPPSLVVEWAASRAIIAWLQVHLAELEAIRTRAHRNIARGYKREANQAQRNLLAAMKQVETLKRLRIPPKRKRKQSRK